jgi:SmpA / OmlA family
VPLNSYEILPYIGVGELRFGMSRAQVHEILGEPDFVRSYSAAVHEYYDTEDITIHYRLPDETCKAIAMGFPCNPTYQGIALLRTSWESAATWFNSVDGNIEEMDIGLIGKETGINLCHELTENDDGEFIDLVNIVLVFQRGYWEMKIEEDEPNPEIEAINSEEDFDAWLDAKLASS